MLLLLLFRASSRTGTTDTTEIRLLYKTSVTIGATLIHVIGVCIDRILSTQQVVRERGSRRCRESPTHKVLCTRLIKILSVSPPPSAA